MWPEAHCHVRDSRVFLTMRTHARTHARTHTHTHTHTHLIIVRGAPRLAAWRCNKNTLSLNSLVQWNWFSDVTGCMKFRCIQWRQRTNFTECTRLWSLSDLLCAEDFFVCLQKAKNIKGKKHRMKNQATSHQSHRCTAFKQGKTFFLFCTSYHNTTLMILYRISWNSQTVRIRYDCHQNMKNKFCSFPKTLACTVNADRRSHRSKGIKSATFFGNGKSLSTLTKEFLARANWERYNGEKCELLATVWE